MNLLFDLIGRNFWLICIAITFVNYRKAAGMPLWPGAGVDRSAAPSPRRIVYLRRAAFVGVLPWLVMGWGIVVGGVPNVWGFFRPQDRNPYVLAWFATLFALAIANALWVFLAGGARTIREYDLTALTRKSGGKPPSETWIKVISAIGPFWILGWTYLVSTMNAPMPR
jgi:hypothetical protein